MRAYDTAEAARRMRIIEEADQRSANVAEDAAKVLDGLLTRLLGNASLEDRLRWGDGGIPEVDDAPV